MKIREFMLPVLLYSLTFSFASIIKNTDVSEPKLAPVCGNIKTLAQLTMEKAGLVGVFFLLYARGVKPLNGYAFVLSKLLPDLLGIREEVTSKQNVSASLYKFDLSCKKELTLLFKSFCDRDQYINDLANAFIVWVKAHSYLTSPEQVKDMVKEVSAGMKLCSSLANANSVESMQTGCYRCNQALTVALENMFFRDTLEDLIFGYLTMATFLLKNPTIGYSKKEINPVCFSQLRNALALDLYPQSAELVQDEIKSAVDSFHLEKSKQSSTNQSNVLNLLSLLNISQNDEFAEKLIKKIDPLDVTDDMKSLIVQHFSSNPRTFGFLKKHLEAAGWLLPKITMRPLPIRMLTRAFVSVHNPTQLTEYFISYLPRQEVDVYHIDPSEGTFNVEEGIYTTCEKGKQGLSVTTHHQHMISIIFPSGIKVTSLMLELLVKWALEDSLTVEEERLVRLIIHVDQVTIIRHEPQFNTI